MGLFVKICGLTRLRDVEEVVECGPDAIGFVFWSGSPRCVDPEEVGHWTRHLRRKVLRVGVFVDASRDEIMRAVRVAGLDIVQLHGQESPDFCRGLPFKRWKALHLDRAQGQVWREYQVDAFLADSYSAAMPGGTGRTADWDRVRRFVKEAAPTPVILAGGLTPENVREAVRRVRPWGVDVSSGVEVSPGRKDIGKVREFIRQCRAL